MVNDEMLAAVESVVRTVVAEEVTPRWRRLADGDVSEKSGPLDLVTIADRLAEERLTDALTELLPGSVVVGEEAVHADPGVLKRLQGDEPVWIVDPVDGTANFVRGENGYATLVALAHAGELLASWTYAPVPELMATARRGRGAYAGGERLHTAPGGSGPLRIVTSQLAYLNDQEKRWVAGVDGAVHEVRQCRCAGLEYLAVARGDTDGVAFTWEAPWDHAAGLLLVTEAGGASRTASGEPFRITGGNVLPFSAARDEETAQRIVQLMAER